MCREKSLSLTLSLKFLSSFNDVEPMKHFTNAFILFHFESCQFILEGI